MKTFHPSWLAAAAAALLVACSGAGDGDQAPRVSYGKLVTFGDSLSDVGTYQVGIVASLGGGKYIVNGTAESLNWTERLASAIGVAPLCAAQTGLNSVAELGGPVPEENHDGCTSYAQGGARVTNPVGPGNINLLALGDSSGALGQLTKPLVEQIARHLATTASGSFDATDLVTVMAGGNDLFMNLASFTAMVGAGVPADQAAGIALAAMQTAGTELAGYIKNEIVAKGATRVVAVNLPDVSATPAFLAESAETRAFVLGMVASFNGALATGLAGTTENVLQVDAFTASQDQGANPAQYGLTNVTAPVCDLAGALASLPTSLVCSANTLIAGATDTYAYADGVHPSPLGYKLLMQLVAKEMAKAGWL
ncbi:MAG: SGNH/GDSL hydrolase family protein [Vitreoscilla sp.]|nr:SGNH/GDSL hydrolase family protein [Vitreoscilla sp.]